MPCMTISGDQKQHKKAFSAYSGGLTTVDEKTNESTWFRNNLVALGGRWNRNIGDRKERLGPCQAVYPRGLPEYAGRDLDKEVLQDIMALPEWMNDARVRWLVGTACIAANIILIGGFLRCVEDTSGPVIALVALVPLILQWIGSLWDAQRRKNGSFWVVLFVTFVKACILWFLAGELDLLVEDYFFDFSYVTLGRAMLIATASLLFETLFVTAVRRKKPSVQLKSEPNSQFFVEDDDPRPLVNLETLGASRSLVLLLFGIYYLFITVAGPFLEEILIRGVLLTSLCALLPGLFPLAVSSVVFALTHRGGIVAKLCRVWDGFLLGGAYIISGGNLLLPILAHSLRKSFVIAGYSLDLIDTVKTTGREEKQIR